MNHETFDPNWQESLELPGELHDMPTKPNIFQCPICDEELEEEFMTENLGGMCIFCMDEYEEAFPEYDIDERFEIESSLTSAGFGMDENY